LVKTLLYGIAAERKSICRDINILKDDAGYDIALSEDNKQGYYMVSRDFEDWELKILIDAIWGAKFLTYECGSIGTEAHPHDKCKQSENAQSRYPGQTAAQKSKRHHEDKHRYCSKSD
jgi:hypothetical protein